MAREDRGYNKTDLKSMIVITWSHAKVVFTDSKKNYLLQYTEQYQRKIQLTLDNSNLQKNCKENYKEMKIASS